MCELRNILCTALAFGLAFSPSTFVAGCASTGSAGRARVSGLEPYRVNGKTYVPLRDPYLRGIAPPEVFGVLEGWATSFANSYTETFGALRVRTKRPTMVLDIPDVALRIGRLHGARSVQLLLVDGLRFDLGLRMEA